MLALHIKWSKQNFGMTACYKYEQPVNRWKCIWAGGTMSPSEISAWSQKSPFISLSFILLSIHALKQASGWLIVKSSLCMLTCIMFLGAQLLIRLFEINPCTLVRQNAVDQRKDLHINIHNTGWINGLRGLFLSPLSVSHIKSRAGAVILVALVHKDMCVIRRVR